MQELAYCGPKNEMCVQNQTSGNQQCLVSCEGLYADIADDSLNQKLDDVYAVFQQKIGGSILKILGKKFRQLQTRLHNVFIYGYAA